MTPRGAGGKHAMRLLIGGHLAVQFKSLGAVEDPKDDEVREAFDIGQTQLKFRQDLELALGFVLRAQALWHLAGRGIRTAHMANRLRGEHGVKHLQSHTKCHESQMR